MTSVIPETCDALFEALHEEVMPTPTPEDWLRISKDYQKCWQFPNCVGSIDGKRIVLQALCNSGSMFYKYKHTFSIVLLAVVDANYRFTYIDVGAYGSQSDGSVFSNSTFGKALNSSTLPLPNAQMLPNSEKTLPVVFVGDEAFPLKENLLRPYPGKNLDYNKRVFNYRLSRARRTVENTFGILASKWRVFRRPISISVESADKVVKACCCLHNYLCHTPTYDAMEDMDHEDRMGEVLPGAWRTTPGIGLQNLHRHTTRGTVAAASVREAYNDYFANEGALSWQGSRVNRCSY